METDSHADTCALSKDHCVVMQDTGRTVTVVGFGDAVHRVKGIPIVTAAVAYDCPIQHQTHMLIFHETLLIPRMKTHLINPLQLRNQGNAVNETLLQHLDPEDRQLDCHSVICAEPPLHIPMSLRGTMSGFTVRTPTQEEIEDHEQRQVKWVHMTSSQPWEPHSKAFAQVEDALRSTLERGTNLLIPESRDLDPLQVRGQDCVSQKAELEGTASGDECDDDSTQATEDSTDAESLSDVSSLRQLSSIQLSSFAQEQQHTTALDVDRYAFEGSCNDLDGPQQNRSIAYRGRYY